MRNSTSKPASGNLKWYKVATFILGLCALNAHAVEFQSAKNIHTSVSQWLNQHYQDKPDIEYEVGHLDSRLNLKKCPVPLNIKIPEGRRSIGQVTLSVECTVSELWKVYVPVKIRKYAKILVARQAIPRGSYLQDSDVMYLQYDVTILHNGYFTQLDEIRNMVTRRSIRQGRVLTPGNVTPPRLVKRGQAITILAKTGNMAIRVKGKALMDGRKGELIRVKNTRSKKELQATVIASGVVRVSL